MLPGMTGGRRIEFTSDPRILAAQLRADLHEIAESAGQVGQRDRTRLRIELDALYHMTATMTGRIDLARAALDDEPVEWEVTDTILAAHGQEPTPEPHQASQQASE